MKARKGEGTGQALLYEGTPTQKRLGMARVVKGSHSFTCHLRIYAPVE